MNTKPVIDEEYDEVYVSNPSADYWRKVDIKAKELLSDPDWVQDTMLRFGLFDDVCSWLNGNDEVMWKVKTQITDYAKRKAEKLV